MCVGIPMTVVQVDDLKATCVPLLEGSAPSMVTLALTGPVPVGGHVLVHLESAIRVLDAEEAGQIANALAAVTAAASGQPFDHLLADLIDREPQLPPGLDGNRLQDMSD